MRKRVFIFESDGLSAQYGIGKYIEMLYSEAKKSSILDFCFIKYSSAHSLTVKRKRNIVTVEIPFPVNGGIRQTKFSSIGIFHLLDEVFSFSDQDVFQINDSNYFPLVEIIKESLNSKILYVVHASLWQFYYNSFNLFIEDWNTYNNNERSDLHPIDSIKKEAKYCLQIDGIITLNDESKKFINKFYKVEEKRIYKINNGYSIKRNYRQNSHELMLLKSNLNISEEEKVILFVGRITDSKGVTLLIDAFKKAYQKNSLLRLILVGGGEIASMLPRIRNFWRAINFLGYIDSQEIEIFYSLADVVVLPSKSEQCSYTVIEAMAFRRPLIVTDIPAFDFLQNNISCLKVAPNSVYELENSILKLAGNEKLRNLLGKKSHDIFKSEFNSKKMFSEMEFIYDNISKY